ncbi:MAG: 4-diphosphocytidyl-2C-methyl-D-erythritol kinase [Rickettsiales bacterium]|nr:4-diphosphocytidyl-2C-methyl-D-erythritol kinase [Rickettsiales bacterium]
MKFGQLRLDDAEGAVLVHSLRTNERTLRKGRILDANDIKHLVNSGFSEVTAANLEDGDISENDAARRLATSTYDDNSLKLGAAGTGRVNIFANIRGIFVINRDAVDKINLVDEDITISTITPYSPTEVGQLVATVKIIPFAVNEVTLSQCEEIALQSNGLFSISPYQNQRTGLLQTVLANFRKSLLKKGKEVTSSRLASMGLSLNIEKTADHSKPSIEDALSTFQQSKCDILLILGASAIADRRDVVPDAIVSAGGEIIQLGMPVDPGNLTLLARLGSMWIVGLPGSARSPRVHGSDWIVQRLVAGLDVSASDIRAMGVGGLLKEIPNRPMPRTEASPPTAKDSQKPIKTSAIVLAAGQSRRMGPQNKLLADVDGRPMIVRTIDAITASKVNSITVVLGYEARQVRAALSGKSLNFIENIDYEAGLSSSLRCGMAALPQDTKCILVCLGDMPRISSTEIDLLIDNFFAAEGRAICVPTYRGKRGNPVIIGRRFFPEIQEIVGDVGARHLIGAYPELVHEVEMEGDAVLLDIDTPEALAQLID